MKTLRNCTPMILLMSFVLVALSSFPQIADAEAASKWRLKTSLMLVDSSTPFAIDKPSGGQVFAGGNAEIGAAFAIEYRFSNFIGLELAAAHAKSPDVDDNTSGNNDEIGEGPGFTPVLLGANFYLTDSERFELYVGPRVAAVNFGSFDLDIDGQRTTFDVDEEFAWGAALGANYQLGASRWSVVAEATYLDVDMTIKEQGTGNRVSNSFDPLLVNLGLSYRF